MLFLREHSQFPTNIRRSRITNYRSPESNVHPACSGECRYATSLFFCADWDPKLEETKCNGKKKKKKIALRRNPTAEHWRAFTFFSEIEKMSARPYNANRFFSHYKKTQRKINIIPNLWPTCTTANTWTAKRIAYQNQIGTS